MALQKINRDPPPTLLRQFAGIWFPAFYVLLGYIIARKTGQWGIVQSVWVVLALWSLAGIACPRAIKPAWIGLMTITFPIGWVVSHILLAGIFYLLIFPIGLVLRLMGKDPLSRRFDPEAKTYWVERRKEERPVQDYFRQF